MGFPISGLFFFPRLWTEGGREGGRQGMLHCIVKIAAITTLFFLGTLCPSKKFGGKGLPPHVTLMSLISLLLRIVESVEISFFF